MAGRPKSTTPPKQPKPRKILKDYSCQNCGTLKKETEYYVSYNPIHKMGRILYCKDCIKDMISDDQGNVILDKVKDTLRLMDKPFLYNIWKTSLEEGGEVMGVFMKNIQMPQYRKLGWADSKILPEIEQQLNYDSANSELIANKQNINSHMDGFIVTEEIIDKWNFGYTTEEYYYFEKKYNQLKNNYSEKTAMHTEALLNYIRYRVKEEIATAKGDVAESKNWAGMAKDAATSAKINPSQLSKADLTEGLNTISELSQAIEREVDIIPILPRFKFRPNDALDFNIWCYVNYERHLKGMPLVGYEDIYNFYDERKADYIRQYGDPYGIFENDPTEGNRENILKFITDDEKEVVSNIPIEDDGDD